MDTVKIAKKNLRSAFMLYVAAAFAVVILLSGLVVWGCNSIRTWLLPASDEVFLNIDTIYPDGSKVSANQRMKLGEASDVGFLVETGEEHRTDGEVRYSITPIDNSYTSLSPRRQLLYRSCTIAMIVFPVLFSLLGILISGLLFYKRRLKIPIERFSDAAGQISRQNLDFELSCGAEDELGDLCRSFEKMRQALADNNRRMWDMLEERRRLQASVAHDLRNPIAIIESHAEFLQLNLSSGSLSEEKVAAIAGNIEKAAKRLERYTDSIREINHLEELEICKKQVDFAGLCKDIKSDFQYVAQAKEIRFFLDNQVADGMLFLDAQVFYRILENLISNALRYANDEIHLYFSRDGEMLVAWIMDDGPGFSPKILQSGDAWFVSEEGENGHSGIGLTICRILCKKHGGELTLQNGSPGAEWGLPESVGGCVRFTLKV